METVFSQINHQQVNRLFPFYFVLDESLKIFEFGRSLTKIVDFSQSALFFDNFRLKRPHLDQYTFEELLQLQNQLLVLEVVGKENLRIRGQFELVNDSSTLLFMGSPWFNDINEVQKAGLSLFDFAFFDPLADLLQVLKNQEIATNDVKELLDKIGQQKKILEQTARELESNQTRLKLLSTIAEKTINGVIITDREGRINWVNESFTNITGYSIDEINGKKPGDFLQGEETDPETAVYLSQQIKEGQSFSCEILNYRKDGSNYWVKILGNPLVDTNGETIGFFALEEDVTTRIQTEQALRDAKERSDAIAQSKNTFLTNMSHEIRTPLNAILGMGGQLQKTSLNNQQQFFLETINSAAEHLMVIINDILDISKVEAGKLNLENIDFEFRPLIDRCINVLSPKAEEKGLLLESFIEKEITDVLIGDPHRLNQILLNLLGNAIKFTERGGVRLFITCIKKDNNSQTLRFLIEDSGVGIDHKFVSQLFAEFSQEDSSIVRKYGGTGLGLNITKKLVDLMGGSIEFHSTKNVGTAFLIEITFSIGSDIKTQTGVPSEIDPVILKDKVILLAEDNEMNRILARTILQPYQINLIEVENGEKAVEFLTNHSADLILMDMQMPVLDGIAATAVIREKLKSTVPIIALTANALKGEREKCLAAGMNEYLSKPFRENDLVNLICRLLVSTDLPEPKKNELVKPDSIELYKFDYLNEVSGNDIDFIKEMIGAFASETKQTLEEIHIFLEQNDFERITPLFQKIKSNLVMLEAVEAINLIEEIEHNQKNDSAKFRQTFEKFENILTEIFSKLGKDCFVSQHHLDR